jgi:hypothetical protein
MRSTVMTNPNNTPSEVAPTEAAEVEKPAKWRTLAPKPPFAWQDKFAFQQIVSCQSVKKRSTALCVYTAMTHISSDLESNKFQCAPEFIAEKAKVHPNTVKAVIPELETAGVIQVLRSKRPGTKENEMNTYILLESGWTPTVLRGIRNVGRGTKAATSELSSYRKSGGREETPDTPPMKEGASSSRSSPSGARRLAPIKSAKEKLAALSKDSNQGLIARSIWRESDKSDAFAQALYDSIIEAGQDPIKAEVLESVKRKLGPVPATDEWD